MKTDEHQHNLKCLLFRKRCKHRLLCLAHKSIFLGKPDYLHNQLKRICILKQIRTYYAILLESNTLFNEFSYRAFSSAVHRMRYAYGTIYRMTYGRSNPYIVLERN